MKRCYNYIGDIMYDNKKIFILGMARSGYEMAKLLSEHNCEILVTDGKEQDIDHVKELESLGVKVIITPNQDELLDDTFDYVVKNPGISPDVKTCVKARELSIPIVNELEVAYHYFPKVNIVAITGSNGKTTTTTLTYEILKHAKLPVHLGGNIGYPMSSLIKQVNENDIVVLELSAQQLEDFKDFKVNIGILTNLVPVHLDRYKTFENYMKYKKKIYNNNTEVAILNIGDENVVELTKDINSQKIYFSSKQKSNLYLENEAIYYNDERIINLSDIRLKGNHNYENIMCAIAVAKQYNVSNEVINEVLSQFTGVEHRLEFVKNVNGRDFYNDSKATNVDSTIIALSAFTKPTILLLGGLDRGHSFDGLLPYMKNVKCVVCYGETKDRIENFCKENGYECHKLDNLKDSVKKAYELSSDGDIILLSPACASWDQYKCFEDRGDEFKEVINNLE